MTIKNKVYLLIALLVFAFIGLLSSLSYMKAKSHEINHALAINGQLINQASYLSQVAQFGIQNQNNDATAFFKQTHADFKSQLVTVEHMVSGTLGQAVWQQQNLMAKSNAYQAALNTPSALAEASGQLAQALKQSHEVFKSQLEAELSFVEGGFLGFVFLVLFVVFVLITLLVWRIADSIHVFKDFFVGVSQSFDFSQRLEVSKQGEIAEMAQILNTILADFETATSEAKRVIDEFAEGKFESRMTTPLKGDLENLRLGLNDSVDKVEEMVADLEEIMQHVSKGDFSECQFAPLPGAYGKVMVHTLASVASLRGVLHELNGLMSQVAEGFFTRRLKAHAYGELQELKENVNRSLDNIQGAIYETSEVMMGQGSGDLTPRIVGEYHGTLSILKEGVNNTVSNTASMMSQSNYSILRLSKGALDISKDIHGLAERTQEQAAAIEETAASMEEITSTIRSTADNAAQAEEVAQHSIEEAVEADKVVRSTIDSIGEISAASSRISEITTLIDSIAFQTNLLALNAAVEAARAGEHGRGFAVVAGEVRSLASKSADAAKDIRNLIDDTLEKVSEGAQRAEASGTALNQINESIQRITRFVTEISQTSQEQAKGVEQVNIAISRIDEITQENVQLVDHTNSNTQEMIKLAEEVQHLTETFNIDLKQISFDVAMQTGDFTFAHARRAHRQWKGVVQAAVDGMKVDFNMTAAKDHTQCALGKWFYGPEGQKFAHLPEMKTVETYHIELHSTIRQIFEAKEQDDIELMEGLFTQLSEISGKVIEAITAVELAVLHQNQQAQTVSDSTVVVAKPAVETKPVKQAPKAAKTLVNRSSNPVRSPLTPAASSDDEWGEF